MPIRSPTKLIMATLLGLAVVANASAQLTLGEVTRQIEASGKRVLAAERKRHQGRSMYRFKLLTPQGRVRKVWVDPNTGKRAR